MCDILRYLASGCRYDLYMHDYIKVKESSACTLWSAVGLIRPLLFTAALLIWTPPAKCQDVFRAHESHGPPTFGYQVTGLADLDGDGAAEYAVLQAGRYEHGPNGQTLHAAARLIVYSGSTGVVLFSLEGNADHHLAGPPALAAAPGVFFGPHRDVNGDGVAEFYFDWALWSGSDQSLIRDYFPEHHSSTWKVRALICDVNGDGYDDLIKARSAGVGESAIWSGQSTALLHQDQQSLLRRALQIHSLEAPGGGKILLIGDGWIATWQPQMQQVPHVTLSSVEGFAQPVGDISGDGVGDFVAIQSPASGSGAPRLALFSGSTLTTIWQRELPRSSVHRLFGSAGDVDADSISDVIVWVSTGFGQNAAEIRSGLDGEVVSSLHPPQHLQSALVPRPLYSGAMNTRVMQPVGDLDWDGRSELLWGFSEAFIGISSHPHHAKGFVALTRGTSVLGGEIGLPTCTAAANSTGHYGTIRAFGEANISSTEFRLEATQIPSGVFGIFVAGASILPDDITPHPGLCLTGDIGRLNAPSQIVLSDSAGLASLNVSVSAIPLSNSVTSVMAGETWFFQLWHRESPGASNSSFGLTRALSIRFQ